LFDYQQEENAALKNSVDDSGRQADHELNRGLILLIILTVSVVGASWLFLLPVYFGIKIVMQLMPLLLASVLLFLTSRIHNVYLCKAASVAIYLFSFASWSYVVYLNFTLPIDELSGSAAQFSGISDSMFLLGLCFLVLWSSRYVIYAQYLSIVFIVGLILLLFIFTPVSPGFLLAITLLTGNSVAISLIGSQSLMFDPAREEDPEEFFSEDLLLTSKAEEEEITPVLEIDVVPLTQELASYDWELILRELNGELKNTADVDQLFKRMLVFLQGVMAFKGAAVGMLQDNSIKKITTYGSDEVCHSQLLNWTNQRVKKVFLSREPILSRQENSATDAGQILHRLDIPVLSGQKAVGLVTLFREGRIFDTNDVKLAASVVFHSMISLREARLQLEVKRLSSETTPTKLTLYTREQFVSKVKPVFKKLNKPRECSLFIVEIDSFDDIVDSKGRDAGVLLYKTVSKAIMSELRNEDVLGRYGNEGFIVLLDETDMNHAKAVAENVRLKVSKINLIYQDHAINTTLSIGLTIVSDDKEDLPTLMRKADMGLFIAKENGCNTVKVSL